MPHISQNSLIISVLMILLFSQSVWAGNLWQMQKQPAKGTPESIGTYALGCMKGAVSLPQDGFGWQVMRPSRKRHFAHPHMVSYIERLAKQVRIKLKSTLMVGDISMPKGGQFASGHRSHQIGLDADIWLSTPPAANKRSLSTIEREKISALSLVDKRAKITNKNFQAYHRNLLKIAASDEAVDRMFVNYAIKKELCRTDKGADWLGKVRPWLGHDHHFHVRLKCPAGNDLCTYPKDYEAINGDGCDDTLDWWFRKPTKAEREEWERKQKELAKQPKPKLPPQCEALIK